MADQKNDTPTLWVTFRVKLKDDSIVFHRIKMPHRMYRSLVRSVKISSLTSPSNEKITRELFREILIQSLDFEDIAMRYSVK
jgi:hypothetical protein